MTIFEESGKVGGVWRENYSGFGLQVPRSLYEFCDYSYAEAGLDSYERFPSGAAVQAYIEKYAEATGLNPLCQFGSSVRRILPKGEAWTVVTSNRGAQEFDYIVVSTGVFGSPDNVPSIKDAALFEGEAIHSSDFTHSSIACGKKVVIVGRENLAWTSPSLLRKSNATSTLLFARRTGLCRATSATSHPSSGGLIHGSGTSCFQRTETFRLFRACCTSSCGRPSGSGGV